MRLISVVMGETNTDNRSTDTLAMLDYGFNMYTLDKEISAGESLGLEKVALGDITQVDIVSTKDITTLNNNSLSKRDIKYDINVNKIVAPVKSGDEVGEIIVYENGKYSYKVPLTVAYDINKASIFKVLIRNIVDSLSIHI